MPKDLKPHTRKRAVSILPARFTQSGRKPKRHKRVALWQSKQRFAVFAKRNISAGATTHNPSMTADVATIATQPKLSPPALPYSLQIKKAKSKSKRNNKQMPAHCGGYSAITKERCATMQTITDRELKEYALVGLLVRIDAESSRHPLIKDSRDLALCESRLEKMQAQYNELLADLRQSAGI